MYPQKNLEELEKQIQIDLDNFNIPSKAWLISTDDLNTPIAIIGAGMSALCLAFALKVKGIPSILFEKEKEGAEGPWLSPALMETLRSPKNLTGPALISPSLTFQAWYKAQYGVTSWEELDKIPRTTWHYYLQWFKKMTEPTIYYDHHLIDLNVNKENTALVFQTTNKKEAYIVEHCVLAMGIDSLSSPNIPIYAKNLPKHLWEHSYSGTDYSKFIGKNIGVIGSSAGAMDSAATALEYGAKTVEILCRSSDLPRVNRSKAAANQGYLASYRYWSDAEKMSFQSYLKQHGTPPPYGSTLRVSKHKNVYFNFNEDIKKIEVVEDRLYVYTQKHCFILEYLIFATGFKLDWRKNIWLDRLQHYVKKWKDVSSIDAELSEHPYLSPDFEFVSNNSSAIDLSRLYCFNYSANISQGPLVGMISGVANGAEILAKAIARKIYIKQLPQQINNVKESTDFELNGDEWSTDQTYRETKLLIE